VGLSDHLTDERGGTPIPFGDAHGTDMTHFSFKTYKKHFK